MLSSIAKSRKYYPKCKSLAKRDWLAEELHAEFLLRICEIGEDKIKEATEYIDWFCLDVINKIWLNRWRVKAYECGTTNPLYEFSTMTEQDKFFVEVDDSFNIEYYYKEAKEVLEKDINSADIDLNYKARVFTYSIGLNIVDGEIKENGKYKNSLQFSKQSKISYASIHKAFNSYKKILKDKLKL